MLFTLTGLTIRLTLFRGRGHGVVLRGLEAFATRWRQSTMRPKLTMLVMVLALGFELLLWILRLDWGALLMLYGLWTFTFDLRDHLALFCAVRLPTP